MLIELSLQTIFILKVALRPMNYPSDSQIGKSWGSK